MIKRTLKNSRRWKSENEKQITVSVKTLHKRVQQSSTNYQFIALCFHKPQNPDVNLLSPAKFSRYRRRRLFRVLRLGKPRARWWSADCLSFPHIGIHLVPGPLVGADSHQGSAPRRGAETMAINHRPRYERKIKCFITMQVSPR